MFFQNKSIACKSRVLFEILQDDLNDSLCTDIVFLVNGKKHRFGAYGDSGETKKNVVFYLDKREYASLDELKREARIEGMSVYDENFSITVTECNGCYPESTPRLLVERKDQ